MAAMIVIKPSIDRNGNTRGTRRGRDVVARRTRVRRERGDGDDDGGMILGAIAAVVFADDRLLYARMYACTCVYVSSATRFDLAGQSHRGGDKHTRPSHLRFSGRRSCVEKNVPPAPRQANSYAKSESRFL